MRVYVGPLAHPRRGALRAMVEAKVREGRLRVDVLAVLGAALGGIGAQVAARARLEELRLPKRFAQQ